MASESGMLKKGKKVAAKGGGGGGEAEAEPEHSTTTSPYTTRAVTVCIGASGANYTVMQASINQYSGLKKRLDTSSSDARIELREVDEEIGHTLIHYIYTHCYETLGLGSLPDDVKNTAEFKRSVLAYCAARLCGIVPLEEVTKLKMEEFRHGLSVFDIQRITEEVSSKLPQKNDWFSENIHKWIKDELMADVTTVTGGKLLNTIGKNKLFDRAVVKCIAEMYSELLAKSTTNSTSHEQKLTVAPTNGASITEPPTPNEEFQQDSPIVPDQKHAPHGSTEGIHSNGNSLPASIIESQSTQNGLNEVTHDKEETFAVKAPPEPSAKEHPNGLSKSLLSSPEVPLETFNGNNENEEELRLAEILSKATDSAGEATKSKSPKKSKKSKKKKKPEVSAAPQTVDDDLS